MNYSEMFESLIEMGFNSKIVKVNNGAWKMLSKSHVEINLYDNYIEVYTIVSETYVNLNGTEVFRDDHFFNDEASGNVLKFVKNLIRTIKIDKIYNS